MRKLLGPNSRLSPYLKALACVLVVTTFGLLGRNGVEFSEPPSLDFVQFLTSSMGMSGEPEVPVTLIAVDDETFEDWGRPFPMDKSRLAEVLETLRGSEAMAVILDYDLSVLTSAGDQRGFADLLQAWPDTAPSLLLARELSSTDGVVAVVPTPFDPEVAANPSVTWANVMFTRDREHKVRTWRLWDQSCAEGDAVYLSPLLIVSALRANPGKPVDGAIGPLVTGLASCDPAREPDWPAWLKPQEKTGPINYVLGSTTRGAQRIAAGSALALEEWSAVDVLSKGLAPEALADRVVIVGASHAESGDWHLTPVGPMEGMRILANAISDGPATLDAPRAGMGEQLFLIAIFVVASIVFHQIFRAIIFAALAFVTLIGIYAFTVQTYGAITAINVTAGGINALLLYLALESVFSILLSIFWDRRGWRSILND